MHDRTIAEQARYRTRFGPRCLALIIAVGAVVLWSATAPAVADGRVVFVGPGQGPVPVGPNERVTAAVTVIINGEPITIVRIEPMPPKAKFVILMPLFYPPGAFAVFPFPPDGDAGGVHTSHEVWVNNPGGGDTYTVVAVSCRPGVPRCEGCKTTFPPGSIYVPDPPQPPGLTFMADRFPADPATESAVLAFLGLPDNPEPEVWVLTTGDLYFFTDNNPPGPPVQIRPASQPGDLNCDGLINAFDIDPFILALTDHAAYYTAHPDCGYFFADVNGDGAVNAFDIDPFIAVLTG
jgi:hypothetical protein